MISRVHSFSNRLQQKRLCNSKKYRYPPRRALLFQTFQPPGISFPGDVLEFPFQGMFVRPLSFQLGQAPNGKNISVKNAVALYYYAKDDCSCDKEIKYLYIHFHTASIISILPCKGLSQLIINGKALRNMETIPYTSQMISCVKESVKFKLNTESMDGLSLLFFSRRQQHYRRKPQYIV